MNIAIYLLAGVGGVVLLLAAVAICLLSYWEFLDWRHAPHIRSYGEGFDDARNRLANDAWWFGESPETCELLRDLARGMSVSEAREKWRKARAKAEAEEVA